VLCVTANRVLDFRFGSKALGQKQTLQHVRGMSALLPKADISSQFRTQLRGAVEKSSFSCRAAQEVANIYL